MLTTYENFLHFADPAHPTCIVFSSEKTKAI